MQLWRTPPLRGKRTWTKQLNRSKNLLVSSPKRFCKAWFSKSWVWGPKSPRRHTKAPRKLFVFLFFPFFSKKEHYPPSNLLDNTPSNGRRAKVVFGDWKGNCWTPPGKRAAVLDPSISTNVSSLTKKTSVSVDPHFDAWGQVPNGDWSILDLLICWLEQKNPNDGSMWLIPWWNP